MSTTWVLGVVGIHPFQLALYDNKAQKEVYGDDPDTLVSSSYAPLGQVEVVDGGIQTVLVIGSGQAVLSIVNGHY